MVPTGDLLSGQVDISGSLTRLEHAMTIPPGTHVIRVHTDAPQVVAPSDPRSLHFRVEHQSVTEIE